MAFSARHPSPHDALSTDRYRPNPLARSLRAAADSKAHLPLSLPDLDALSGLVLHHESTRETGQMSFTCNSKLKGVVKNGNPISEPPFHVFARKESVFLLKLQPKRVLQWAQTLTEPHPSHSCQSYVRTEIRKSQKCRHKTSRIR